MKLQFISLLPVFLIACGGSAGQLSGGTPSDDASGSSDDGSNPVPSFGDDGGNPPPCGQTSTQEFPSPPCANPEAGSPETGPLDAGMDADAETGMDAPMCVPQAGEFCSSSVPCCPPLTCIPRADAPWYCGVPDGGSECHDPPCECQLHICMKDCDEPGTNQEQHVTCVHLCARAHVACVKDGGNGR